MLILASASPRRRELLTQLGCSFEVVVSATDECSDESLSPEELTLRNATQKALAVAKLRPEAPVLGADTVVALDGHIYGKPRDEAAAIDMLKKLVGKEHLVITGIALAHRGKVYTDAVTTKVAMAPLTEAAIKKYVATGEPLDKAGAYAVQGKAAAFITGIVGSFSNVVGLPLHTVCTLAETAGVAL
ncbi:MAG: septum formation inhibitor Maf [Selenomonadaceae bacterium]|nr:septum formation inhibitor Maf [Selenomonadaceae bacterium]